MMCADNAPSKVRLTLLVIGSFIFFLTQLLSGNISGCIALQAYSYYVLTDTASLFVGLLSVMLQNKGQKSTETKTYGWSRLELLGSVISHIAIVSLCFCCGLQSLQFLITPDNGLHQHCKTVLAMGVCGIAVNLSVIFYSLLVRCCTSPADVPSTRAEVESSPFLFRSPATKCDTTILGDACLPSFHQEDCWCMFLKTVVGLIAAVLIVLDALVHYLLDHHHFWIHYVDPCLAMLICGIITVTAISSSIRSAFTLLLHIPDHVDVEKIKIELRRVIPEIEQIHELHVWRMDYERIVATIHIVFKALDDDLRYHHITKQITDVFKRRKINSVTFQPEFRTMVPLANSLGSAPPADSAPPDPTVPSTSESSPPCPCTDDNANEPTEETRISLDFPLENECIYACPSLDCARDTCCRSRLQSLLKQSHGLPELNKPTVVS